MKKIIIVLLSFSIQNFANALDMCVRNSSLVVSLDSTIPGLESGDNETEKIWWTDFPYGRLYGEATCLSEAEGGKPNGERGSQLNTKGEMIPLDASWTGLSGDDPNGNPREYCWCKITHPVSSRWVYHCPLARVNCVNHCAEYCGKSIKVYEDIRASLFNSIGQ